MFCIKCGKEVPEGAVFCPFCGQKQGAPAEAPASVSDASGTAAGGAGYAKPVNSSPIKKARYNILCIIGLVIGAIALVFSYIPLDLFKVLGILAGIAAVIVAAIGVVRCNRTNENGRIHGVLGVVAGALTIIFVIIDIL
ncbi:MAG: zinc-ribbon domain-containing protein [Clostridia bacterium]|nr:zinc-ribbon domain-containing protein [Clostridia bacterium]